MTEMAKWKKVILLIITIIIALRIGFIAFRGEVDREYITSAKYDLTGATSVPCQNLTQWFVGKDDYLNSLELIFSNIADDKLGAIEIGIYSHGEMIYYTKVALAGINNWEWKKIFVNAELSAEKEYNIFINAAEGCTQIPEILVVNTNFASEIMSSNTDEGIIDGQYAINYGYLRYPSVADRAVVISLWLLFGVAVYAFILNFERIGKILKKGKEYVLSQVKPEILATVLELILCIIIINSSGIEFQAPTRVILYSLSLISVINLPQKKAYIDGLLESSWKKTVLFLLYVYAAFSLVGHRIFIYPLTLKLTSAGIFVFICTIFWFVPIIQSLLYYLQKLCIHGFTTQPKMKKWQFMVICILATLLPAAYNLFANNPGITSYDTYECMIINAQNLHGMFDWHPAFYCMILGAIETVWNSTYAVIIVQYIFWAYVVTELMLYLRKKNVKETVLIAVTIFTGLNAANFIHINTIWKDIPYTLSLLWALIIAAKLSIDFEEYKYKWNIYLELIICLVGMYFWRKNGMVSVIIIALALALVLRRNVKVWISLGLSVMLILAIKGPLYNYFEVKDPGRFGMYIGLNQDILGVYYAGGEVSEDTLKMINAMTEYNNAEYSYTPTWSIQSYDLDVEVKDYIFNYIDTFLKNPITMMRAIIAREDALWGIFIGQDSMLNCVNYTGTLDGEAFVEDIYWNDHYSEREYVSLYSGMSAATAYTASSQWINAIMWRCGLFTLLGLISITLLIFRSGFKKYIVIYAPLFGHIMSLLLSTGWSDFRYFWPMNLMNMTVILLSIVIMREGNEVAKNEKKMVTSADSE